MSGTLARLLVIGFPLSYGCSVLRSLISRQRCRVRQQARESSHEERAPLGALSSFNAVVLDGLRFFAIHSNEAPHGCKI